MIALAFINALRSHADSIISVALVIATLAWLEYALSRRFARHEVVEQRAIASLGLTSDAASAAARVNAGHIDVLRADLAEQRADLANINVLVKMHDQRLGALSERLMIAALRVPTPKRDEP